MNEHVTANPDSREGLPAGLSFAEYLDVMERYAAEPITDQMSPGEREHARTGPLNLHRVMRIIRTYVPGDEIAVAIGAIGEPQTWLMLTEPWCGDSAQNVPHIATLAALNPLIELRLLLRDTNPDIMDRYLTDGTRGIPKLVALAEDGRELFRWGPRPAEAQRLFLAAKLQGVPKDENLKRVHLWYGRNGGRVLEEEVLALVKKAGLTEEV